MYKRQNLDKSLELKLVAHDIFQRLNDSVSIAISLQGLGSVYTDKRNYEKAKDYASMAFEMYGHVFSKERQSFCATTLGTCYRQLGQLDSAEFYFMHTRMHGKTYKALWRDNESYLANLYATQGQNKKSLMALKSLVSTTNFDADDPRSQDYLSRITGAYLKLNEIDSAELYYQQVDFDKIEGQFGLEVTAYKTGYELMSAKGDFEKALEHHVKLSTIEDSIFNIKSQEKFDEIQTKYETEKKRQEIKLLNTQNDLQKIRLTTSRNTVLILSGGIILLAGLLYRLLMLKRQVQQSRDEKDTLLREIHHRVKNNLQVISALLTLQSAHLQDAQAKSALKEGQDRVQSMALIHKDLYQHDNLKGVNTKDYLEQLIDNLLRSYQIDESEIRLNLNIEEINLDVDTMIPLGLLTNELMSNAFKHAFDNTEKGVISIILKEKSNILHLVISDNGIGVQDVNSMKNQSFGYSLVQSFARKLDAEISIDNKDGLEIRLNIKNYKKV